MQCIHSFRNIEEKTIQNNQHKPSNTNILVLRPLRKCRHGGNRSGATNDSKQKRSRPTATWAVARRPPLLKHHTKAAKSQTESDQYDGWDHQKVRTKPRGRKTKLRNSGVRKATLVENAIESRQVSVRNKNTVVRQRPEKNRRKCAGEKTQREPASMRHYSSSLCWQKWRKYKKPHNRQKQI